MPAGIQNTGSQWVPVHSQLQATVALSDPTDLDEQMGIVQIGPGGESVREAPSVHPAPSVHWVLTLDRSDSMRTATPGGRTRMELLRCTLTGVLQYMVAAGRKGAVRDQLVSVQAFDSSCETLCEAVSPDQALGLLRLSPSCALDPAAGPSAFDPRGTTNLEAALKGARGIAGNPETRVMDVVAHVFLTDGYATMGELSGEALASMVHSGGSSSEGPSPRIRHTFIGLGADHDARLLTRLAEVKDDWTSGRYYLVPDMECSGCAYGDALHACVAEATPGARITVRAPASVYDATLDTWSESVETGPLARDQTRCWSIRTPAGHDPQVAVEYRRPPSADGDYRR